MRAKRFQQHRQSEYLFPHLFRQRIELRIELSVEFNLPVHFSSMHHDAYAAQ